MKSEDMCEYGYCKKKATMTFYNKKICHKHYIKHKKGIVNLLLWFGITDDDKEDEKQETLEDFDKDKPKPKLEEAEDIWSDPDITEGDTFKGE